MRTRTLAAALSAALAFAGAPFLQTTGTPSADLILINGRVYTVDEAKPWAAKGATGAMIRTLVELGRSTIPR